MMAWEKLSQASVLTNSTRFWSVVNSPMFDDVPNSSKDWLVPAERWVENFGKVYSDVTSGTPVGAEGSDCASHPLVFTTDEVIKVITSTAGGKLQVPMEFQLTFIKQILSYGLIF